MKVHSKGHNIICDYFNSKTINKLNNKFALTVNGDFDFILNNEIIKQSNLYIKQQGAGNGKTYGLIQNLKNKNFSHYDYFIIVSKQHSAKTIIYNEFNPTVALNYLKDKILNRFDMKQKSWIIVS